MRMPGYRPAALTSGLCLLSALIKPNYVIAFLPVWLALYVWKAAVRDRLRWRDAAAHALIVAGPIAVVLVAQALLVSSYMQTRVILAPFAVWSLYSPNLPASLLLSVAFPAAILLFYRERWRGHNGFVVAWLVFAVALVEFALFAEAGPRFTHANFAWGPFMALFLVFLVSAQLFFKRPIAPRDWPALLLFLMHLGSGIFFYARIVMGFGYR
jgi:hypothetical protein